jgi:hypothetical protein
MDIRLVTESIKILKENEWIRQDKRDTGPWDSTYSTYYTLRNKREEIDALVLRRAERKSMS